MDVEMDIEWMIQDQRYSEHREQALGKVSLSLGLTAVSAKAQAHAATSPSAEMGERGQGDRRKS